MDRGQFSEFDLEIIDPGEDADKNATNGAAGSSTLALKLGETPLRVGSSARRVCEEGSARVGRVPVSP